MPEVAATGAASDPPTERVREGLASGSPQFLAALFSGSPDRPLLDALYAFEAELRRIVCASSHEAAHARLQWWRGELDRLAGGRPSHPLAQALLPARGRRDVDLSLLQEALVGADLDLARMTYSTWQELDAYLFRSAGAVQTLIAALLAGERGIDAAEREFARRLAAAVRQSRMILDFEHDLRGGRLYAPLQALEAASLQPANLLGDAGVEPARGFLADWATRTRRELTDLPAILAAPEHRRAQRHGLVLAALHLQELDCAPGHAATNRGAGPLARLWTAWRTALRHR